MKFSVTKFMKKDLVTVKADDLLEEAYQKLRGNKIRHLPVVDGGDVVGIISDRDFQRALIRDKYDQLSDTKNLSRFPQGAKVGSFMSWPVKAVSSSESLIDACKKMIDEKISALIVTENDRAMGIITHEDLLRMLVDSLVEQEDRLINKVERWAYNSPIGQLSKFLSDAGI